MIQFCLVKFFEEKKIDKIQDTPATIYIPNNVLLFFHYSFLEERGGGGMKPINIIDSLHFIRNPVGMKKIITENQNKNYKTTSHGVGE